ncbi:MAG: serine--tRNA ligase [Candidatus Bathyarchaeia archaeon]
MSEEITILVSGKIAFSKNAEEAEDTIAALVEKSNRELFVSGIPSSRTKVATKIVDWSIEGESLNLTIISGTYARAPAALLRFRKLLAEEVGAKYRIGVREVEAPAITIKIPTSQLSEQTLERIRGMSYVRDANYEEGKLSVTLKPIKEGELKRNIPDRVMAMVSSIVAEATKAGTAAVALSTPVVRRGDVKPVRFRREPSEVAAELGWIKEFPGRGQWIYTPPYTKLLELMEEILLNEVIRPMGFQPFMLPKLIPLEVMRRMPGYLEDIPEGMYYVCHPPREPEAFAKFKETVKITKSVPKGLLKEIVKEPEYVLAPAQCEPFWYFFSHETVKVEDLPFKFYDRAGWTYRWEGGGVEGLTRIHEFRRIELGYLGTPEQVVKLRDSVRDRLLDVVENILDMEWRVVAATPFYMKGGEVGDTSQSQNVAAYDIEVYLPYRGERDKAEWLEIAACFIHRTKFVESFSIHEAKGRPIWTGCTGIGISRWVAAFLATHGFNPENWPKPISERFGDYELPRTLLWPKERGQES